MEATRVTANEFQQGFSILKRQGAERSNTVFGPFSPTHTRIGALADSTGENSNFYRAADFDRLGVKSDPSSLFEATYSHTLRRLVSHVISVEVLSTMTSWLSALRALMARTGRSRSFETSRLAPWSLDFRAPRKTEGPYSGQKTQY